jgi:hypothetical protein
MSALPPKADALTCIRIRKQDNSIRKTGQPDKSPQIEAIRGKPRIAIFLLITNSEASGNSKTKGRSHAQQTFSVARCFVYRWNNQCRFCATCPHGWFRPPAQSRWWFNRAGYDFRVPPKHRVWKQQRRRIGWNPNRANNSWLVRSSIRHEPFWDWCRRALIPLRSKPRP